MTTITYANYCLAADTQLETTFIEQDGGRKIYDLKDVFVAGAGIVGAIHEWITWYENGCDIKVYPTFKSSDKDHGDLQGIFLVSKETGLLQVWGPAYPYPAVDWTDKPNALGSGESFAIGALLHGASAWDAVSIAAKLDPHTGGLIETYPVKPKVKSVKA